MTKSEILAAMGRRRALGKGPGQAGNDWAAGFRAAEALVKVLLAASKDAEPEPVSVVYAPRAQVLYDPNLTAQEVCGPFNPAKAIHAGQSRSPSRAGVDRRDFGGFEDDEMVAYDHGRTVREALGLGRVDQ